MKQKKKAIDYYFGAIVIMVVVWTSINLWEAYFLKFSAILVMIKFCVIIFCGVVFLFTSYSFRGKKISKVKKILFLILPLVSCIFLFTNDWHGLFFEKYSFMRNENIYGNYFYIHTVYSYGVILLGIYHFFAYAVKHSGVLSKQALLVMMGVCIPILVNGLYVFEVLLTLDLTPITFALMILLFWFSAIQYDFLKVIPIAYKNIIDHISDGFVVVDREGRIIQYNRSFYDGFHKAFDVKLKAHIIELFQKNPFGNVDGDFFKKNIENSIHQTDRKILDYEMNIFGEWKAFTIEITPLVKNEIHQGTMILFKDITQGRLNLEMMREHEGKLLRAEKYSFLGELAGGLTHIIKNKISSISYYAMFFEYVLPEYQSFIEKIEDPYKKQEEGEIFEGFKKRITAIQEAVRSLEVMVVDVTRQVSELAREEEMKEGANFRLGEFLSRIRNFVEMEAKEGYEVEIEIEEGLSRDIEFEGVLANFVQVIMNLLLNSIYEYKKLSVKEKLILKIENSKKEIFKKGKNWIDFSIIDFGRGIPPTVREVLFQKMVTTKGNEGAGIGLYTAGTVVKDKLNGEIQLLDTSVGSHFLIRLPCK
jgi:signal transduction histidine kinase